MILPLSLVLALSGSPSPASSPTIDAARALLHEGRLEVSVKTSLPVQRRAIRTKVRARYLVVYVDGAQVRPDRTQLGTAELPIEALPRPTYAKLQISFSAGLYCAGPIAVSVDDSGVHAGVACSAAEGEAAAVKPAAHAKPAARKAPEASDDAPAPAEAEAAVAIAAPPATAPVVAPVPAKAKAEAPVVLAAIASPAVAASAPATPPAAAPAPAAAPVTPPVATAAGRSPTMVFAPVVLVLAAVAGFVFWRRRRVQLGSHIHILETAALGPKRALILAEVDGTTLIIGASEAGISLLSTTAASSAHAAAPAAPDAAPAPVEATAPKISTAFADLGAPDATEPNQSSAIARLFGSKNRPPIPEEVLTGNPEEDDAFAAMLLESIEDQELRARLANGVGGKVA